MNVCIEMTYGIPIVIPARCLAAISHIIVASIILMSRVCYI